MKLKKYSILLILLSLLKTVNSQNPYITKGVNGYFIFVDRMIPKNENGAQIFRDNLNTIQLNYPETEEEFISKVHQFYADNPYYSIQSDSVLRNYWQWSTGFTFIDSLPLAAKMPDVLIGLGVMHFEKFNEENKNSSFEVAYNGTKTPLKLNQYRTENKIKYLNHQLDENYIQIHWILKSEENIMKTKVYKQYIGQQETMNEVNIKPYLFRVKDSVLIKLMDTNAYPGLKYKYYIKTIDYLGFENKSADSVEILNIPRNTLPVIMNAKSISDDVNKAIVLKWKLQHHFAVQTIDIYRSPNFDSGFVYITTVNNKDTSYIDYSVQAAVGYWYKFVINGVFERGINTTKIGGILKIDAEPPTLKGVTCVSSDKGIIVRWIPNSNNVRGYYLYRANGYKGEMQMISPLIKHESDKSYYEYIDSSLVVRNGNIYSYAIKVYSNGYVFSEFSDTSSSYIAANENMYALSRINTIINDDQILLQWDNINMENGKCLGYRLYRTDSNKTWQLLNQELLNKNQFNDTSVKFNTKYSYKLCLVNYNDQESNCLTTDVLINSPSVFPPEIMSISYSNNSVEIEWENNNQMGVDAIELYRMEENNSPIKVASLAPNQNSYTDKTIEKNKSYFYYIVLKAYGSKSNNSTPTKIITE